MAAGYCYCLGIKSNDFFLKDNKKAFILWLNVPKVTAYFDKITEGRYVAVMCRKRTMTPNDTSNLDNFERKYSRFGKCQLVAVEIDDQMHVNMNTGFSEAIELKKVIITDAWKVSAQEPTRNALEWDDDPIIPESEKTTAPVIELLKNLREVHNKTGEGN